MTLQTSVTLEPAEHSAPGCAHHWVIQAATGPMSSGFCRICGAVKEFKNYVDATYWGDDTASNPPQLALPARRPTIALEDGEEE